MSVKRSMLFGGALVALVAPALAVAKGADAAKSAPVAAAAITPAPVAALVKSVDIPYTSFTLKNGLRVIVHTDRKAPIVAVSVWYDVGSKMEPAGKTGFAHLFEHLMFNGSENAPDDYFKPLKDVGATDINGTTNMDRTNYFETVPTPALDRALFLESDRMGWLTGAITQGTLDEQRGVVQNEKRQGDNRPYGLGYYALLRGLFPAGHPYSHTTIGSMADLDSASLADVKAWFHDHYGPNNAVLVLAGDVDAATARPLVEKYFGAIPAGPRSARPAVAIPTLAAPKTETLKDRVAMTQITRAWVVPGMGDPDAITLDVVSGALGGTNGARLRDILVRKEKLAVGASSYNQTLSQAGLFVITVMVKPGVDPARVTARLDQIVADFIRTGPTADEIQRTAATIASNYISGLESVGGKASTLAQGALAVGDPTYYRRELTGPGKATVASVRAAAAKWLGRPAYTQLTVPGARESYEEAKPVAPKPDPATAIKGTRRPMPAAGGITALSFPEVRRARLGNGMEVIYANRSAVPMTSLQVSFDAGYSADPAGKLGTQQLTLGAMSAGTTSLDEDAIAKVKDRLGAYVYASAGNDRTAFGLLVPSVNLSAASALLADEIRHPAFAPEGIERKRGEQLAQIASELTTPSTLAWRVLPGLVFGPASPYARLRGAGDPATVKALTRDDLIAFHDAWFRPDRAKILVVSDRPLPEVVTALNTAFGDWTATGPAGVKDFSRPAAPASARIVLIDRPDSPQSLIVGAVPTAIKGTTDFLPLLAANDGLGGGFLGRINMNLREDKHWAYGASGGFWRAREAAPYTVTASVQADKTGASLAELRGELKGYVGGRPMTQDEFDRAVQSGVRELPGQYETARDVLGAMSGNELFDRPDDYVSTVPGRYRALTLPELRSVMAQAVDPAGAIWVVVGDAAKVRPQLDSAGLPVEVVPAASLADAKQP